MNILEIAKKLDMVRGYYDEHGCFPNQLEAFAKEVTAQKDARISELEEELHDWKLAWKDMNSVYRSCVEEIEQFKDHYAVTKESWEETYEMIRSSTIKEIMGLANDLSDGRGNIYSSDFKSLLNVLHEDAIANKSNWLAEHDAEIRKQTLEEAAQYFEQEDSPAYDQVAYDLRFMAKEGKQ